MRDEVSKFEKRHISQVARLDVPLLSVVNLRRVAGNLRALAQQLDFLSRSSGDAAEVLPEAWRQVRHTNRELQKIKRVGRPRKDWLEKQWKENSTTRSSARTSW